MKSELSRENITILLNTELNKEEFDLLSEIFFNSNDFINTGIIHKQGFDYLSISIDKIQFFYLIPLNLKISLDILSVLVNNELNLKFYFKSKSFLFISNKNELSCSLQLPMKLISYIRKIYKNKDYVDNNQKSIGVKKEINFEEFHSLFINSYLYKLDLYNELLQSANKTNLITMEEFLTKYILLDNSNFQYLSEKTFDFIIRPVLVQKEDISIEFLFFITIFNDKYIFNIYDYKYKNFIQEQLNISPFLNFVFINKDINNEYQVKDYLCRKDIDYLISLKEHNYTDSIVEKLKEEIYSYNVLDIKNFIKQRPDYSRLIIS